MADENPNPYHSGVGVGKHFYQVNILGSVGHTLSVTATPLCSCWAKKN